MGTYGFHVFGNIFSICTNAKFTVYFLLQSKSIKIDKTDRANLTK